MDSSVAFMRNNSDTEKPQAIVIPLYRGYKTSFTERNHSTIDINLHFSNDYTPCGNLVCSTNPRPLSCVSFFYLFRFYLKAIIFFDYCQYFSSVIGMHRMYWTWLFAQDSCNKWRTAYVIVSFDWHDLVETHQLVWLFNKISIAVWSRQTKRIIPHSCPHQMILN